MKPIQFIPLACAAAIYIVRLMEINTKRNTISGKISENLTLRLFLLVGTALFVGSIAEYFLGGKIVSWPWIIAGCLCGIFSFWLRRKAIAALGKFWSLHVEIRENHEFVKTGPFRWLRHPVYFSMILELLALGLVLHAPWTMVIIIPFLFVPVLMMRVRLEEAALIEKFGEPYRAYRKTTPAIFPFTKF
jgi:protein-S-isoprenylcysteine O-methyltransferase Ste14